MPAVRYRDIVDHQIEIHRTDASVLEVSLGAGLAHFHQCRGAARCTTCRVRVIEGEANLSLPTPAEALIAAEEGWPETVRLACQAKVLGDVTVARLILDADTAAGLFPSDPPLREAEERPVAVMFSICGGSRPSRRRICRRTWCMS